MVIIKKINKRVIPLRTRKTYQDDRMTYSYGFSNGDKYTLEINNDGITEADIKLLHSLYDNEGYNNCKNARPESTKEKNIIKLWRKNFIEDTINKSGKDIINPMSAWFASFPEGPIQDNDKNKVNKLQVALHPDKTLVNDQMSKIKKDGTVSGAIAYKLTDLTTPVKLTAYKGIGGIELGSQEFAVK